MSNNTAIAPVAPLLLDVRAAARLCGVSVRTWWALYSAGKTPIPMRLGRRTLWRAYGPHRLAGLSMSTKLVKDADQQLEKPARPQRWGRASND